MESTSRRFKELYDQRRAAGEKVVYYSGNAPPSEVFTPRSHFGPLDQYEILDQKKVDQAGSVQHFALLKRKYSTD